MTNRYEHDDGNQGECKNCGELMRKPRNAMPFQPIGADADGVIRFRPNRLVQYLLDHGPFDLNDLAHLPDITNAEHMQLSQLIGYSVSGAGALSFFDHETVVEMDQLAAEAMSTQDELQRALDNIGDAVPMSTPKADDAAERIWLVTYEAILGQGSSPLHASNKADEALVRFVRMCRPWAVSGRDQDASAIAKISARASDQTDLRDRFVELVMAMGRRAGNRRGWKGMVAKKLGLSPYLSRVMTKQKSVGHRIAARASRMVGFPHEAFFTDEPFEDILSRCEP